MAGKTLASWHLSRQDTKNCTITKNKTVLVVIVFFTALHGKAKGEGREEKAV